MKVILALGLGALSYQTEAAVSAAINSFGSLPGPGMQVQSIAATVGIVLWVLWGWALPVFVLTWIARPKVAAEVARWGTPGAAGKGRDAV